nr:hypothetical protein BaRGS_025567 [Batillaria attramentaria]
MGVNGQDVDLDRITMIPDVSPLPESCRKVALLSQGDTDGTLAPSGVFDHTYVVEKDVKLPNTYQSTPMWASR